MPIQFIQSPETLQNLCVDVVSANMMNAEAIKLWSCSTYKDEDFAPERQVFLTPFDMIRK